ncbi:MAG: hypothetical protein F4038_05475 [Chloroflexi bacterium]|nr:hypothetical protein [Chloroflexota bacterium]MYJ92481.1 hypothetical protein [Chloroflexota bacterium]
MNCTTNPFHFRAKIDRLWRRANSNAPAHRRLDALDAVVRELFAPNDRARRNHRMYLATDPFDVARHLLRDLHDRPSSYSSPASEGSLPLPLLLPLPLGEGWGEGPPLLADETQLDEDDDPL